MLDALAQILLCGALALAFRWGLHRTDALGRPNRFPAVAVALLLVPALRALAGLPPLDPPRVRRRLASPVSSPENRHQFLPVRIEGELAWPTFKGSGEITSLSQADGYIEIPVGVARLDAGSDVEVVAYE